MNFEALVKSFANAKSLETGNDQYVRYNAFSKEGQKAIALYDQAIAEMKRRNNQPLENGRVDPTSWKYQAAIHGTFWQSWSDLNRNVTKYIDTDQEETVNKFNFFNTKEELENGDSMVNNCTHFSKLWNKPVLDTLTPDFKRETTETIVTDITINFMPWHRLYLENFENIVRTVLQDLSQQEGSPINAADAETWALPYWEYTKEGQDTIPDGGFTDPSKLGLYEKSRSLEMQVEGKGLSDLSQPEQTVMLQYDLYKNLKNSNEFVSIFDFQAAGVEKSKEQNQFAAFATYNEQNPHNNFHDALGGIADSQEQRKTLWQFTTDYAADDNVPLWGYKRSQNIDSTEDHNDQYSKALEEYPNVLGDSREVTVGPGLIGFVPTAARDPLFWLHHAYIDKVWSEWNATYNAAYLFAEDLAISPWNYEFFQYKKNGEISLKTYSKWGSDPNAVVSAIYNPNYIYDDLTNNDTQAPNPVLALIDHSNYRPIYQSQSINRPIKSFKDDAKGFIPLDLAINLSRQEILNLRDLGINITAKIRYKAKMNASHNIAIFAGSSNFFENQGKNIQQMWEQYSRESGFESTVFKNSNGQKKLALQGLSGDFQPYNLNQFAVGQISLLPMSGSSMMEMPGEYYLDLTESVYRQNTFAIKNDYAVDNHSPLAFLFASSDTLDLNDAGLIVSIDYLLDANFSDTPSLTANNFDAVAYLAEHPELLKLFASNSDATSNPDAILKPEDYFNRYGKALGHTAPRMNYRAAGMGMQYLMNNPDLINQASSSPYKALEHYLHEGMHAGHAFTYNGELSRRNWLCDCSDTGAALLDFSALSDGQIIEGDVIIGRDAAYKPTVGFYQVINQDGAVTVGGTTYSPGDTGYADAAISASNLSDPLTGFNANNGMASSTSVGFSLTESNKILAPFAQVNGNYYFTFAEANPDGINHFTQLAPNVIGLEDLYGGGDEDFDDLLIGFILDNTSADS